MDKKKAILFFSGVALMLLIPFFVKKKKTDALNYAINFLQLQELPKEKSNELINQMFKDLGYNYKDNTAWCSLFVSWVLKKTGNYFINTLTAKNYLKYPGKTLSLQELQPGNIVILTRNGGGHIGFFVKTENNKIYLLGGNQSDQVNVSGFNINTFLGGKKVV